MKYKNIFERYADKVNNLLCPGMPDTKIIIFVRDEQYNSSREPSVEAFVNEELIPWAFMNGIYCSGMFHGNFAVDRSYKEPKEVIQSTDEDYDFNTSILNFVFAVMAAATKYDANPSDKITVVAYWGEADMCDVWEFDTEEEFYEYIKDDLAALEEYDDEEEEN